MKTELGYLELVGELNDEMYNIHGDDTMEQWFYTSSGYIDIIGFGDIVLWNSEDNERKWIEKKNDYEPMIPFLKKTLRNYGSFLKKISK